MTRSKPAAEPAFTPSGYDDILWLSHGYSMSIMQQKSGTIGASGRHIGVLPAVGLLVLVAWIIFGGVYAPLAVFAGSIYLLAVSNLAAAMYVRGG